MGFWNRLFGKKGDKINNSYCPSCKSLHFVPKVKEDVHTVIDGVSYANEYCSHECEVAAELRVTDEFKEIEFEESGDESSTIENK